MSSDEARSLSLRGRTGAHPAAGTENVRPAGLDAPPGLAHVVVRQVRRSATRTLCLPPRTEWSVAALVEGHQRLAQLAAAHGLQALEHPLLALLCDPTKTPRSHRRWQQILPVRGGASASVLGSEASFGRAYDGLYLDVRGQGPLDLLHQYLLEQYLPRFKHALTRPCIYHRLVEGGRGHDESDCVWHVLVPVCLAI